MKYRSKTYARKYFFSKSPHILPEFYLEKIEILHGIHEIWKEVTENNSDLKISYHNATVGLEYKRQKASYSYGIGGSPKDASMGLNVLKNKDRA